MSFTKAEYTAITTTRKLLFDDNNVAQGLIFARSHMVKDSPVSYYLQAYLCIICGFAVTGGLDKWRCCCDAHAYILKEMHRQKTDNVADLDPEVMKVLLKGMRVLRGMILRIKFQLGYCYAMDQVVSGDPEADCGLGIEIAVHEALGLDLDYDLHKKTWAYHEMMKKAVEAGRWLSPEQRGLDAPGL